LPIYDFGESEGYTYLAMRLIDGALKRKMGSICKVLFFRRFFPAICHPLLAGTKA